MKTATVFEIKKELQHRDANTLMQLCLRLSKFKKENKELLTYLLFQADDEEGYVTAVKDDISEAFATMNTDSYFYMKKSVRKILRNAKKHIRYSSKKETEVELLLHFCQELRALRPSIARNTTLQNLYQRQLDFIEKKMGLLHEDLQYDYGLKLEALR
ncbi:hypothetical protein [Maribacter sp. 2307ULW6-5]|uniref:hypothetical protein n=1 Tax=Maribacter sp. 2307ULW6-5 TaxID=3386275 RepID=UPI0039BCF23F